MKHITTSLCLVLLALLSALAVSCITEDIVDDVTVGEGQCTVTLGVTYTPPVAASLQSSRSVKGDAIRTIHNIFVVWYKPDGTYAGSRYFTAGGSDITVTDQDRGTDGETVTQHAELKCSIPYGTFRIYAAVNMGDMTSRADIRTERDFKAIQLTWNPDDVAANYQMSGYFATSSDTRYAYDDAPVVTINRNNMTLHAWVRRAASKVTVAFDAQDLNENIYIYIEKAQLKDIPASCPLVNPNTPTAAEALIADGDTIDYRRGTGGSGQEGDYRGWLRLSRGAGSNYYGNHANDAPSLFFYENMQGMGVDKHVYQNFESKDDKPYGTYLEVTGYYVNNGPTPSSGRIIYRCMLGRNMTDDFNAERNAHYKVTLKFKNDANDPDWHIVYENKPQDLEVQIPTPMYISYLPNQVLEIPITVNYNKDLNVTVTDVRAQIITNNWGYDDQKYNYVLKDLKYGFLSLRLNDVTSSTDYLGEKSFTSFTQNSEGISLTIPVYTRPLTIEKSFSGANIWVGRQRYAQVKVTATFSDGSQRSKTVDVIQVRRLINPTGVWRSGSSQKPFRVTLQETHTDAFFPKDYVGLVSEGPWKATVVKGSDWVQIKSRESQTWSNADVEGGTGSVVDFDYRPGSTTSAPRFGLIKVTYHNNTCVHMILVSQGMGTVSIAGNNWHMSNVKYAGVDEATPLFEGSMFKFGTSGVAYKSSNSLKSGYGFPTHTTETNDANLDRQFDCYDLSGGNIVRTFREVGIDVTGFDSNTMTGGGISRVANYDDWETLTDARAFDRYYGILYGDECDHTITSSDAAAYTYDGDEKGMLGCFVYEKSSGNHLFFPMGNTGNGRRQYYDCFNDASYGQAVHTFWGDLKYADRTQEMASGHAELVPCYYNLWESPGAVYWYGTRHSLTTTGTPAANSSNWRYGFDINFMTYGFTSYTTNHVYENRTVGSAAVTNSDACYLRRISN